MRSLNLGKFGSKSIGNSVLSNICFDGFRNICVFNLFEYTISKHNNKHKVSILLKMGHSVNFLYKRNKYLNEIT